MGVELRFVEQDVAGGRRLLAGKPPLRVVRKESFGGILDTRLLQFIGPSRAPVIWYVSAKQGRVLMDLVDYTDRTRGKDRIMVRGAMGSGKTELLAMAGVLLMIVLVGTGVQVGITSPTQERTQFPRKAIIQNTPSEWRTWSERWQSMTFATGCSLQFVGTKISSKAVGSRVQGWNWAAVLAEEFQDTEDLDDTDSDLEARGRSAPLDRHGDKRFKRLTIATAKPSPAWRNFSDRIRTTKMWTILPIAGLDNPFLPASHWEDKKRTMSDRDYRRKVLAEDVAPERMSYTSWNRDVNLRPIPRLGARDVTSFWIRKKTGNPLHTLLVGTDPGTLKNVSIMLRAFELGNDPDPYWWVVGELTTEGSTIEHHAKELLAVVARRWGCNVRKDGPQIHVRCDPYGRNVKQPDKDVYRVMARMGIDVRAAEYSKQGTGTGQIKIDARIDMVIRLLKDASDRSRLFIDVTDEGQPVAPRLVEALSMSERDEGGRAETERKDEGDLSHWPSALAYGLWPFEKEAAARLHADARQGQV
jgi:hypothetical protein